MSKFKPLLVGITGGIGSGQTTVSSLFEKKYACKVIQADLLARQILETYPILKEHIANEFGPGLFDEKKQLKRNELAKIIFSDKNTVQRLNRIVHPVLVKELISEIEKALENPEYPLVIVDAALIYEMAMEREFHVIVVVHANKAERVKRVMERDKIGRKEVLLRMATQFDLKDKCEWADFVIYNNSDLQQLEIETDKLFTSLMHFIK